MGTTSVNQLLRSLCVDSPWKYAVFWKLKHRNRMFLTWEDGYCNYPETKSFGHCNLENFCYNERAEVVSSQYEIKTHGESSDEYPIGLVVANMSCLRYSLGEGFMGRAASTGKHCWVYSDDIHSALLHEYPNEWQLQFASGIKTILLVPVTPLGVVQLGSVEKVTKDMKLVACIKDLFSTLQLAPEALPLTLSNSPQGPSTSSLSSVMENSATRLMVNKSNTLDNVQIWENRLSLINPDINPMFAGQGNTHVQNERAEQHIGVGGLSSGFSTGSFPHSEFFNPSLLERLSNISDFFHDEASGSAQRSLSNLGFDFDSDVNMNMCPSNDIMGLPFGEASANYLGFGIHTDMNMDMNTRLCFPPDVIDKPFGNEIFKETDRESAPGRLTFPADSELHKALGPAFLKFRNEPVDAANVAPKDVCSGSGSSINENLIGRVDPSVKESSGFFKEIRSKEDVRDGVVSGAYTALGDAASSEFRNVISPTTSSGQLMASCQSKSKSQADHMVADDLDNCGSKNPPKLSFVNRHHVAKSSVSESSLKSTITTQVDEIQQKGFGYINSRKGTKLSHVAKRKSRLGEVQKPRPRDRQLIQDRLRELRELIPNGEKCSIDSLLDRTIKHMLFLRSIGNQAEKLKHHTNQKVVGSKKMPRSSETEVRQDDRNWKIELGHQLGVCPVIVEDLDYPGHMLIEVLCDDHGLFLEIAQVLRNLELTILEGVSEPQSDKILAHFIVEVSSGFNKTNIFWPLMNLLQRSNPVL